MLQYSYFVIQGQPGEIGMDGNKGQKGQPGERGPVGLAVSIYRNLLKFKA